MDAPSAATNTSASLSKGETRWNEIWDSYPQGIAQLPSLDSASFRKLCCPEWLTPDGIPLNEDSVDLYGTTSNPGASDENMAAYMDRLRILMEAGALGMLFPYGMQLQKDRSWVLFNRSYKPVGMGPGTGQDAWIVYEDWPVGVRLSDLDRRTMADLSCTGVYDEEWEIPGQSVHFWEELSVPTRSARNMDAYLSKLRTLAVLDGRSNSRAPWRYRLGRYARRVVSDVKPGVLVSALLKIWRP